MNFLKIFVLIFTLASFCQTASASLITRSENFDSDPNWTSFNLPDLGNNYGFRNSGNTTGNAGEVGGSFNRSNSVSWFGDTNIGTLSGADNISASGSYITTRLDSGYNNNMFIGHFNRDAASPQAAALGFLVIEASTSSNRIFLARGATISHLLTVSGINTTRDWSYSYDANSGSNGNLTLSISGSGGGVVNVNLNATERSQLNGLNTFGLLNWNTGSTNGSIMDLFIDDVQFTADVLVPEPTSLTLLVFGLCGVCFVQRKQKS